MRIFITVLLLTIAVVSSYGQTIGGNGEGLTKKYTLADIPKIQAMGHIAIRFPGGSSGKDAYMDLAIVGFGMREDSMRLWAATYKKDENGEDVEASISKDLQQDTIEDQSYLYDMAYIQHETGCDLIWQLNVFAAPGDNINAINDYLSIRFQDDPTWTPHINYFTHGNELYFIDLDGDGSSMDGPEYITLATPHINAIGAAFPTIPQALCYAQDVTNNKQHRLFNDAVENYIRTHPGKIKGVDSHPYLNAELAAANALHPSFTAGSKSITKIPYSAAFSQALHNCFQKYNEIWPVTKYYQDLIDTIHKSIPGTEIITTEWQSLPVELYGDVISNGAYMFYIFTQYRQFFKFFLAHNVLGDGGFAFIQTHAVTTKARAVQLSNELPVFGFTDVPADGKLIIPGPGEYYFRSINMTDQFKQFTVQYAYDYEVSNHFCWGLENYSAMGNYEIYLKNPPQQVEVWYEETTTKEIKGWSFGVIKITAHPKACDMLTWYADLDHDGFGGQTLPSIQSCDQPVGYVADHSDCNDSQASVNPAASEACNYMDDNCNLIVDEGVTMTIYFPDEDNDGYGAENGGQALCSQPPGYVSDNTDCNDLNASIHPGAVEPCGNTDNNCDDVTVSCPPPPTPEFCYKKGFMWFITHKCVKIPYDKKKCNCPASSIPK